MKFAARSRPSCRPSCPRPSHMGRAAVPGCFPSPAVTGGASARACGVKTPTCRGVPSGSRRFASGPGFPQVVLSVASDPVTAPPVGDGTIETISPRPATWLPTLTRMRFEAVARKASPSPTKTIR